MKATEQYFPVVLFIMLYKVVLTFESVSKSLYQMEITEQYFPVLHAVRGDSVYCAAENVSNTQKDSSAVYIFMLSVRVELHSIYAYF